MNVYLLKRATQTLTKTNWGGLKLFGYDRVAYTTSLATNRYYRNSDVAYVDAERGLYTSRDVEKKLVTNAGVPMFVHSAEPKNFVTLRSPLDYRKEASLVIVTDEANKADFEWLTGTNEGLELIKKTFPANRYGVEVFVTGWDKEYNYMSEEDLKVNDFVRVTQANSEHHKYGVVTNVFGKIYNDELNKAGFYTFNRSSNLMQTAEKYDIEFYNLKRAFYDHDFVYPYLEKNDLKIYRVFPVTVNGEKWVIYNDVDAFNKKIAQLKLAYIMKNDEFKEILMHFLYYNYEDGRRGFNDEKEFITYGLTEYYRLGNPDKANATAIVISF